MKNVLSDDQATNGSAAAKPALTKEFIVGICRDLTKGIYHNDYPSGSVADRSFRRTARNYGGGRLLRQMRSHGSRDSLALAKCLSRTLALFV